MKRTFQTLLVLTTAAAVCSPAFAIGEKKEERFILSSASPPTHRTDNTAITGAVRRQPTRKTRSSPSASRR